MPELKKPVAKKDARKQTPRPAGGRKPSPAKVVTAANPPPSKRGATPKKKTASAKKTNPSSSVAPASEEPSESESGSFKASEPGSFKAIASYEMTSYDRTPYGQDEDNPPVIVSYASATDSGNGEHHMWAVGNMLRAAGVNWYTAKFTNDLNWQVAWFGRLGLPSMRICIVILSPEYMASPKCRKELLSAAQEDKAIIPLSFGPLPRSLRDDNWFGETQEDVYSGILIRQRLTNMIPPRRPTASSWIIGRRTAPRCSGASPASSPNPRWWHPVLHPSQCLRSALSHPFRLRYLHCQRPSCSVRNADHRAQGVPASGARAFRYHI